MLGSKFSKTLHFNEHNITNFFKRFKEQCDEYELIKKNNELNFFITVLSSLQSLLTFFLYI